MRINIRPLEENDRTWANQTVADHFASTRMITRGKLHDTTILPGFIAEKQNGRVGLILYRIENYEVEVMSLIALRQREGIGQALLHTLRDYCQTLGLRRLWLITTNNNRSAQAFYQKMGMTHYATHLNAVDEARQFKPEIPEYDKNGLPIKDELEFEWQLK